ncbi:tRNA1(Val) (adenine(37)-N6)-methyltransferase [Frigoriflavimonas asaccharolytica]|uniref:tRNA1Val (Adenine37-N6)-methyltransferase n=1 Tax=Frigoriflavimonas asaccharolytica TaxID=2735899 RepID=A0A8J8K674_9FLAO|nr:methyltransferase [Frigoriflavimonas asaccharolytica]NRS93420.1 tRNA1Val (adenine37-N6)-methyltransferase [Frigoriflavimonas asaccharolytica]
MKAFIFQQFSINQDEKVFRVGTDAVLLGSFADVLGKTNVLEIGCGTGIISMMLAQRNQNAEILAIDIDENAVELAEINFINSIFSKRLQVKSADYTKFNTENLFDLIVCNPPYFEVNPSEKDILARQKLALNFEDLIKNASKILNKNGLFSVIIPAEDFVNFNQIATENLLYLKKKIEIFGIEGGTLKRVLLEFSKEKFTTEILKFTIEKSPRKYSEAYLELTKEFHLFGK